MYLSLYVITDQAQSRGRSTIEVVRAAIAGGATAIQLRDKTSGTRKLVETGLELRELTRASGVKLIVNDRADVALAIDADGVHVGQDDLPAAVARRIVGPGKIVGVSAATPDEARQAERDGADYIGVGSIFATSSKSDAGAPIGTARLAEVARSVRIPAIAIGGIHAANAAECIAAGAVGVSVISAVVSAADIEAATLDLRARIDAALEKR